MADPASLLRDARRITIKVGSSLIADEAGLRRDWLGSLAEDFAQLKTDGRELLVVSSGAVALGRAAMPGDRRGGLGAKQAAAAVGQPHLMRAWSDALAEHRLTAAQLLLTIADTETRRRWLNARVTIDHLLGAGALPIVNENDSVATEELRYGDNDRLSARVAQLSGCDLLVLLSDVDGLYSADPRSDPKAVHVAMVSAIDAELLASAGGPPRSGSGTGGMRTKLEAAAIAQRFGCATIIASGTSENPLQRLIGGQARATVVRAEGTPAKAYKAWIAGILSPAGTLRIDAGAVAALCRGGSLLPSGLVAVDGDFVPGECVRVAGPGGEEIGRGLVRYDSREAAGIAGAKGADIAGRLGYSRGDAMIHRDDLVLE